MKLSDTLTGKKRDFAPAGDPVRMYVCGLTPYAPAHVGHAMGQIVFDVLHRYLEFSGYKVRYVQNFTDIDDKLIARAAAESTTVMNWSCDSSLPHPSTRVQIRVMIFSVSQPDSESMKLKPTSPPQLSLAVGSPVAPGSIEPPQSMMTSSGKLSKEGASESITLMFCGQELELPAPSMAVHVRRIDAA